MTLRADYASGKHRGVWIDDPLLPASIRKKARYQKAEALAGLKYPFFDEVAGGDLFEMDLCTPYVYYLRLDPKAMRGSQATGDCVSWGIRNAIDLSRVCEIAIKGEPESYMLRQATAMIYAERGHTGQGASPSRLSRASTKDGILLERQYIDGKWDFRNYSSYVKIGMRYGRSGLPDELKRITRRNRCKTASNVRDMDSVRAALANGYGIAIGSSIGVSSRGGHKGVPFLSRRQGSWAHEMSIIGYDTRKKHANENLYIWDQSWGNWNSISGWPEEYGPKPQGAFVLTESDTWFAVRQGEAFAHSNTDGFPPQKLPDFGATGVV